jgi:hypothetical protein
VVSRAEIPAWGGQTHQEKSRFCRGGWKSVKMFWKFGNMGKFGEISGEFTEGIWDGCGMHEAFEHTAARGNHAKRDLINSAKKLKKNIKKVGTHRKHEWNKSQK